MREMYMRKRTHRRGFGVHMEQGPRTAKKTFSEHGQDDRRLCTDGDGTHLDDLQVVYRHVPGGTWPRCGVVDHPKVEVHNPRSVLAIGRRVLYARRGELCGGWSPGRSNEGRMSASTYAPRSSFGHSHGSKLKRLRRTYA
jgi:hypothetical protein